jgi:hypothetical protein
MKSVEIVMLPVKEPTTCKGVLFKLGFSVIVEAPMGQERPGFRWVKGWRCGAVVGSFPASSSRRRTFIMR